MSSLETIQRMMAEQVGVDAGTLSPEVQLESLGVDSLAVIEFMFNIEDEFNIKLPDERGIRIKTIQDIADIVDRLIAKQKAKA